MKVKDVVMYQATTRDYKVGEIIEFGKQRNFQAERVFATNYRMPNGMMPEMFLEEKLKKKKKLNKEEMRSICDILWNYGFAMREIGMEICRQKYYAKRPSRLSSMFLCENVEDAKMYLSTAKTKGYISTPKVVAVKLNGELFKTNNSFNRRDGKSIDEFEKQSHDYWSDNNLGDKKGEEYLFEGIAEIVEIIQ